MYNKKEKFLALDYEKMLTFSKGSKPCIKRNGKIFFEKLSSKNEIFIFTKNVLNVEYSVIIRFFSYLPIKKFDSFIFEVKNFEDFCKKYRIWTKA